MDFSLKLSWRRPLSYRNLSIDLLYKSMDWFLYGNGLRHEWVKDFFSKCEQIRSTKEIINGKLQFLYSVNAYFLSVYKSAK